MKASQEKVNFPGSRVEAKYNPVNVGAGNPQIGWLNICRSTNFNQLDPIVSPGQVKAGHMHEFFGNPRVDGFSTTQSLVDVATSEIACNDRNDKSGYWVPTVLQNGKQVKADHIKVYYRPNNSNNVKPIPLGLRMIAGDAKSTATSNENAYWLGATDSRRTNRMVRAEDGQVRMRFKFPDCWDGEHLDSPDHQSHVAYSDTGVCPSSHPVRMTKLQTFVVYETQGAAGLSLSSGDWRTLHMDFWNGWNPAQFRELVDTCVNGTNRCRQNGEGHTARIIGG